MLREKYEYVLKNIMKHERGLKDLIEKKNNVEVIHYDTYITTKIKSHKDEIKTDFDYEWLSPEKVNVCHIK